MPTLKELLDKNRLWAERIKETEPDFFSRLSVQQAPQYLWIGCSDSRVSANQIVDLMPGEVFVHRNIANLVIHTDLNCLSVIHFAVEVLKVKHIIVCGHYECGGVIAAMDGREHGLIDNWLRHIKDTYRIYQDRIDKYEDILARTNKLCELNVREQVANVCHTTIVQGAWKSGQELSVHGWIYSIRDGVLKDLNLSVSNGDDIAATHKLD